MTAISLKVNGKAVSGADYRGKIVVLYFGYTHCPDVCPTTLAEMAAALKRLGPAADRVALAGTNARERHRVRFRRAGPDLSMAEKWRGYCWRNQQKLYSLEHSKRQSR